MRNTFTDRLQSTHWPATDAHYKFFPPYVTGQGSVVEETYERRDNIRHHQPITLAAANEVALVSAGRGTPIRQTVAIPLNMVPGNEVNMHGIPTRIPHSHTDIAVAVVKTEKV